ncbi:MAG: hypothetical protein L0Y72_29685 [Gemmataceae bacterium]|nr:hypothetical protein [Gemmataceae bacterium]MCI0743219.1 hypothetical protein [Gemmataceae bacterium]
MKDSDSFAIDFDSANRMPFNLAETPMIDPSILRVYLASPLTNSDPETSNDCRLVREMTRRILENYDYLGIRFEVYDPAEVTPPGSEHTSEEVYLTDHNRTANADLVIFHVNGPSLGVGMEAQIAAGATVPRVVVSKKDARVSRMFLGLFSPTVGAIQYANDADYEAQLSKQLPEITRKTLESAKRRRPFIEDICDVELGRLIFKQRILHSITIDALARSVDIGEYFLRRVWREYVEENEEEFEGAIRHRSKGANVVTLEGWQERYTRLGLF